MRGGGSAIQLARARAARRTATRPPPTRARHTQFTHVASGSAVQHDCALHLPLDASGRVRDEDYHYVQQDYESGLEYSLLAEGRK
jgi:hypothetical protein